MILRSFGMGATPSARVAWIKRYANAKRAPRHASGRGRIRWFPAALRATLAFDLGVYSRDGLFKKVDMAAMLCSLERRAPFLDRGPVEFSVRFHLR